MTDNTFGTWLQKKYLEWAMSEIKPGKEIQSQIDFGIWLGVKQSTLSTWMCGAKTPSGNSVDLLAEKLGLEVYDVLGLPKKMPNDKNLIFISESWFRLSEEERIDVTDYVKKVIEKKEEV